MPRRCIPSRFRDLVNTFTFYTSTFGRLYISHKSAGWQLFEGLSLRSLSDNRFEDSRVNNILPPPPQELALATALSWWCTKECYCRGHYQYNEHALLLWLGNDSYSLLLHRPWAIWPLTFINTIDGTHIVHKVCVCVYVCVCVCVCVCVRAIQVEYWDLIYHWWSERPSCTREQ